MRRAAKVDDNQGQIVTALRKVGAFVWIIGRPVDLLVGYRGKFYALEVKDGAKVPSARKLTPTEADFIGVAEAAGLPVAVVLTAEQAIEAVTA